MAAFNLGVLHHVSDASAAHEDARTIFETRFGITREIMQKILLAALSKGGDFAEIFFEYRIFNSVRFEEELLKDSTQSITLGVGIRTLHGDQTGFGYTSVLDFDSMKQAALTAAAIANRPGKQIVAAFQPPGSHALLYSVEHAISDMLLKEKIDWVTRAYQSAQSYDSRIEKIQATLGDEIQHVLVANSEGLMQSDSRPQARLMVAANAHEGDLRTSGYANDGGRISKDFYLDTRTPESIGTEAAREAITLLSAENAPAGEFPVVLGCKQSGVMIHEAVGHPLEADGNRRKTSIMWDKMNQPAANPLVTIYDDPNLPGLRGSYQIDDEGTVPRNAMLIENGVLTGHLNDLLNARMMNAEPNGHGRRQSYQDYPIPRMANTILKQGDSSPEEIIESVRYGFYADSFEGGMVQNSGKFTFSVNLGYLIENGKLTKPLKNATLIGTNVQILKDIDMIGNDMGFFLGTCGKSGQRVPVTAGTPTFRIRQMTIGGRS